MQTVAVGIQHVDRYWTCDNYNKKQPVLAEFKGYLS